MEAPRLVIVPAAASRARRPSIGRLVWRRGRSTRHGRRTAEACPSSTVRRGTSPGDHPFGGNPCTETSPRHRRPAFADHRGGVRRCHHGDSAPPASVGPGRIGVRQRVAPRAAGPRRGADPARRPRQRAPDARPEQGPGLDLARRPARAPSSASSTSTRTSRSSPALAESHEISADAKTLTFTLSDAKYSNGDPIVAGDLVYSWKRLVDPRTAAPYCYVMAEVAGGGDAARPGRCGSDARRTPRSTRPRQARRRGAGRQDVRRRRSTRRPPTS